VELLVEVLKYVSGVLAILAPLAKQFFGASMLRRPKELEERFERIKRFFDEGGIERHPLIVEASFAAAIGHTRLNADEIRILLRQRKPTQFIGSYVRVRDYLSPSADGMRLELQSVAAVPALRWLFIFAGVLLYAAFVGAGLWLTFWIAPQEVKARAWSGVALTLSLAVMFGGVAFFCLGGAGHLYIAKRLEARQT
jgi:hypothetical protein